MRKFTFAIPALNINLEPNAKIQLGLDLYGEARGDQAGHAVCMPHTSTLGIGGPTNGGLCSNASSYTLEANFDLSGTLLNAPNVLVYPYSCNRKFLSSIKPSCESISTQLFGIDRRFINTDRFSPDQKTKTDILNPPGIYFMEPTPDSNSNSFTIIKQS